MNKPFLHPRGYNCRILKGHYFNERGDGPGRVALRLEDWNDGSPVATITVNLPEAKLDEEHEVCVKDWSENEGMLNAIIAAGFAQDTGRRVPTGFVEAAIVRIDYNALAEYLAPPGEHL